MCSSDLQQGKHAEAEAIRRSADGGTGQTIIYTRHPNSILNAVPSKKRKAEHKENRGLRRSARTKGGRVDS